MTAPGNTHTTYGFKSSDSDGLPLKQLKVVDDSPRLMISDTRVSTALVHVHLDTYPAAALASLF